jgi:hypothetical protein
MRSPLQTGIAEPEETIVVLRHNQQVPSQLVQTPNANSSSLNMFKIVTVAFQQITTELNGAKLEDG